MTAETVPEEPYGTANDVSNRLVGGVVERLYYTVPTNPYSTGREFSTYLEAVAFAKQELDVLKSGAKGELAPLKVSVVTRMKVSFDGGSEDWQISSTTVTP